MNSLEKYLQELKQNIAKKGDISEKEIIRYIYINLGRKMSFDLKYIFGNQRFRKSVDNKYIDNEELEKILQKKRVICKQLAYLFKRCLDEFEIDCSVKIENDDHGRLKHAYNIITLKNGERAKFDLEEDLEFIQTFSKTKFFGLLLSSEGEPKTIISSEELKAIDTTTAEYIPWGFYFDDVLAILKLGTRGMQIEEKLRNVLENLNVYFMDCNIGYVERTFYHNRILHEMFSEKELNRIHQIDCYRERDNEKHYVSCIVLDKYQQDNIVFLYSEKTGQYEEVGFEGIGNEISNGLILTQSIQGLRKYLNSRKSGLNGGEMMDALRTQMSCVQQLEEITSSILPSESDKNVSDSKNTNSFERLKRSLNNDNYEL